MNIYFKFENGGSYINFQSGSVGNKLEISPISWSGSAATSATGDVVFIYKGEQ